MRFKFFCTSYISANKLSAKENQIISKGDRFSQYIRLLKRCQFYVGNDTGPMHLAAAVGQGDVVAQLVAQVLRHLAPQHRLEDAVEADKTFTMLMGDEVAPRREFIESNAHLVKELDI